MNRQVPKAKRFQGFTLVEATIGLVVGVVVTVGLLQTIAASARAYGLAREELETTLEKWRQSRTLIEQRESVPWRPEASLVVWGDPPVLLIVDPRAGETTEE